MSSRPPSGDATANDSTERRERLRWLGALRWWAMSGAILGAVMAASLEWKFVVPEGIAFGVVLGVVVNGVLLLRAGRSRPVGPSELSLHSIADAMALTWLLAFSGGLANPISATYSFHVVLGALLAGRTGALIAGAASALGIFVLFALEAQNRLPSTPLREIPEVLRVGALGMLLLGLSYFALVLAARLREEREIAQNQQNRAEQSLALLFDSLDALQVGIEVAREGDTPLRNLYSEKLVEQLGEAAIRKDDRLTFIDAHGDARIVDRVSIAGVSVSEGGEGAKERDEGAQKREPGLAMLWIDRTDALVVEQRHIMLERLATLGRALQGVAHELNTPLMTMQTLARDLSAAFADITLTDAQREDIHESIDILVDEARRCRALTQGLLATAHPERPQHGAQTAAEIAERAARLVGDSGRRVVVDVESLSMTLTSGADFVLQILMNLIQNALLATPDAASAPIRVRGEIAASTFCIVVEDRGGGIPDEVRERLFEPFVTTRLSGEGTGLGLYTSLRIAKDLGGDLTLGDSVQDPNEEAKGTIARLRLPLDAICGEKTSS